MRRWIAMLLAMLTLMLPAHASEAGDWYLETGLALALDMCELANDDSYIRMMSAQKMEILDVIPKNTDEFGEVWQVKLRVSDKGLMKLMGATGEEMSETAVEQLSAKFPSAMLTMFNSTAGAQTLAASVVATASHTFKMPSSFEPCLMLIDLHGVLAGVAFMKTGGDTVTVACQPIFLDEDEAIADKLEQLGQQYPIKLERIL